MSKVEKVILTNMCLIYKDDEILVIERKKKDWPGLTLPGGHIEKDENFIAALKREVKEETNLDIYKPKLCGIEEYKKPKDADRYLMFLYKTNCFEGEIKSSNEGEVFWIKRKDLKKYSLSLDLEEIIDVIEDENKSELYYYIEDEKWQKKIV